MEIPDSTPSWNALQAKLSRRKRQNRLKQRMTLISGLVCGTLIMSVLISGANIPQRAYAHLSDFVQDVIEVFLRKPADDPNAALTVPPPIFEDVQGNSSNAHLAKPEQVTLQEAQQHLAFSLLLPSYVPEQLNLADILIYKDADGAYRSAYLEYADTTGTLVKVNQRQITVNTSVKTELQNQAGTLKDVTIGGKYPGILLESHDGMVYVEWIVSNVRMLLSGPLQATDALDWAGSFQP